MIVLILEKPTPSLKGLLTRWLLELHAGVFIGKISPRVREKLWSKVIEWSPPHTAAIMIAPDPEREQGFSLRTHGMPQRILVDREGLFLVKRGHPDRKKASRKMHWRMPYDAPRRDWGEEWPPEVDPIRQRRPQSPAQLNDRAPDPQAPKPPVKEP